MRSRTLPRLLQHDVFEGAAQLPRLSAHCLMQSALELQGVLSSHSNRQLELKRQHLEAEEAAKRAAILDEQKRKREREEKNRILMEKQREIERLERELQRQKEERLRSEAED